MAYHEMIKLSFSQGLLAAMTSINHLGITQRSLSSFQSIRFDYLEYLDYYILFENNL